MNDATALTPVPPALVQPEAPEAMESAVRRRLDALVIKSEVSLGGLGSAERDLVFVWLWAVLPLRAGSEAEVNQALKATLAGAASWLDVDHVELRRWLVDSGCLRRDGYGRAYVRARPAELPGRLAAWVAPLAELCAADGLDGGPISGESGSQTGNQAESQAVDPGRALAWASAWVQTRREAQAAERARKRERWQAAQASASAPTVPTTGTFGTGAPGEASSPESRDGH